MKTKRIMVNVKPKSRISRVIFEEKMYKLHACYLDYSDTDRMHLTSINNQHSFAVNFINDSDWEIIE